ncbi:MAG: ABC transporter substrate-binding protein [Candidatus Omnitrophica bacterium]|nr:ABC transporter substrate-binding protein [Candidatus Omnitrophota bacterium]
MVIQDYFYPSLGKRALAALLVVQLIFCPPCLAFERTARHGGQIVSTLLSDPRTFNPLVIKDAGSSRVVSTLFEGLTTTNAYDGTVEPNLAESWTVSNDGLTWTFHLRHDVRWNDGEPMTADDVVFTFNDLVYNDDIPASARDIFTIEGQEFEVSKIDDYTVQFVLPVKFAPFLRALGQEILPKHRLKKYVDDGTFNFTWGIDTPPGDIVGTGPFMMRRYDPGQRIVLVRNPYYWKKSREGHQLPYIDKLIYMIVQSEDVMMLKFLEGSTDSLGVSGRDYPLIKPLEKKKNFTVYELGADFGSQFIFFNQNRGKDSETGKPYVPEHKLRWFTDLNFRRAVAHAIDKEQIIAIVKNKLGYPQYSPIGPGAGFFHNPNVPKHEYNPAKARQILAEAGYVDRNGDGFIEDKEGNRVEFNLNTNAGNDEREEIAGIIRTDLERIGMKVNFQQLEFNTLVRRINTSFDWDAIILGLTGGVEPHFGKNVWDSSGQLHMWYPKQESPATKWEARIDEIFNKAVQELDQDKRKAYYDEFQVIVAENLPLIYTVLGSSISAVRNKFGNLDPTNLGGVFHNLEELYILEEYK